MINDVSCIQGVSTGVILLADADADAMTSGAKAAACGRLASLSAVSEKGKSLLCFLSYMKMLYFDKIFIWSARTSHS